MMVNIYREDEIELLRESSLLVGKTLAEVAKHLKPGVTTKHLDTIAEEFIMDHKAKPVFKGYFGYPASLCISINEQVVHGIPGERVVKENDIISIDCGTVLNGYVGDSAYTFAMGEVQDEVLNLLVATKESLYRGIEAAIAGNRIGDIGYAIQSYVEAKGYSVVRELVGHGVGKKLHEKPEVPNFGRRGNGVKLKKGMVIAIEPMINLGTYRVFQENDGWTIRTQDLKPSAHYEHDVAIGEGKSDILSSFELIENSIKMNKNINPKTISNG